MRDRVAHHYWATDPEVVWATACDAVPGLRRAIGDVIAAMS
ncbi:MAG: HepT-like ribonuclease domain-containing protein [Gemmatimonadaceae bacterium]